MSTADEVANELNTELAMQSRCPACLREQYVLNVVEFSEGAVPCDRCGVYSRRMTYVQWHEAMRLTRLRRGES